MITEIKTKARKEKEARISGGEKPIKVAVVSEPEEKDEKEDMWQAENDARTLMEAEIIRADKSRFAKAQKIAKEKAAAFSRIAK
jgi:hypothetical protein